MLNLPKATELNKFLPKKAICEKFNMTTQDKDRFDADIKKLVIANEISPTTVNISKGEKVGSFFVLQVLLKSDSYSEKNIAIISRLINQNILFVLEYSGKARLVVFHHKLLQTDWKAVSEINLELKGLNLDHVWENIIIQVGGIEIEADKTIDEQIKLNEMRQKLQLQIETIEKQARCEKQPKKKFELVERLQILKIELESLN